MKTIITTGIASWYELDLPEDIALTNDFISDRLKSAQPEAISVWNLSKDKFNEIRVHVISKDLPIEYYKAFIGDTPKKMLRKDIKQVAKNHYAYDELNRLCRLYLKKCREIDIKELI